MIACYLSIWSMTPDFNEFLYQVAMLHKGKKTCSHKSHGDI